MVRGKQKGLFVTNISYHSINLATLHSSAGILFCILYVLPRIIIQHHLAAKLFVGFGRWYFEKRSVSKKGVTSQ